MKDRLRQLKRLLPRGFSKRYRRNLNPDRQASQGGEDGIIREILRRLEIEQGWFVEFGAWDGVRFSNTFALVQRSWKGVYIEGDAKKANELEQNMRLHPGVISVCRFVSLEGANRLDAILSQTPVPRDFDVLSIDIDGNDYWIWKSLTDYMPKVVVIEYNANFAAHESKTIPYDENHCWDDSSFYGASAAALNGLGETKGYTLVACTRKLNLFFLRNDLMQGRFKRLKVSNVPIGEAHGQQRLDEFIDVS